MDEKVCAICHLEVTNAYVFIHDKYYHPACWVNKVAAEEKTPDEMTSMLYELLIAHGYEEDDEPKTESEG